MEHLQWFGESGPARSFNLVLAQRRENAALRADRDRLDSRVQELQAYIDTQPYPSDLEDERNRADRYALALHTLVDAVDRFASDRVRRAVVPFSAEWQALYDLTSALAQAMELLDQDHASGHVVGSPPARRRTAGTGGRTC